MKIKGSIVFTITIGTIANIAIGYGVSYLAFTFLIVNLGFLVGILASWLLSFIVFYAMFLFYAWSKKDWIGIEKIKASLKNEDSKNLLTKILVYANKKGEMLFFIALSIKLGPFTSLVYMRDPHDYNKMQRKDWKIFLIGFVIANIFCTAVVLAGLLIYKSI